MLNLDTHILIFALEGSLSLKERKLLEKESWGISAIVLWELAKLSELGRIEMDLEDPEVLRALSKLHVWPIDLDVCRTLKKLDFNSDPADELIAATSLLHKVPLLTRDRKIKRSKRVPLAKG
ncbi:MAG: type II toxin-antitoxin system VapC family toxin [Deltaproteobacteria bacterium]|nr:type II toxin-antitoxin system VapC family toxin [Deltaproteobacteria bacterium]